MPNSDMTPEKPTDNHIEHHSSAHKVEEHDAEIDLVELLFQWLEHIKFIILFAVIGALASAFYTFFLVTPIYEATAKLYVLNSGDSALNLSDLQIGSYLASDYVEVFKTWEVHESVIRNLGNR